MRIHRAVVRHAFASIAAAAPQRSRDSIRTAPRTRSVPAEPRPSGRGDLSCSRYRTLIRWRRSKVRPSGAATVRMIS